MHLYICHQNLYIYVYIYTYIQHKRAMCSNTGNLHIFTTKSHFSDGKRLVCLRCQFHVYSPHTYASVKSL